MATVDYNSFISVIHCSLGILITYNPEKEYSTLKQTLATIEGNRRFILDQFDLISEKDKDKLTKEEYARLINLIMLYEDEISKLTAKYKKRITELKFQGGS